MSTTRTRFAGAEETADDASSRLSLKGTAEELAALRRVPSLNELSSLLSRLSPDAAEVRPYVGFKEGTYARHRVFRNEFAELLVLCWRPGQRTPIHDHNGSHGAVRVHQGVLWETIFGLDDERGLFYERSSEWRAGQITGAEVPDVHLLGNPDVSGQDLVTFHVYAPPLVSLNVYRLGSRLSVNTLCMDSWNPTI